MDRKKISEEKLREAACIGDQEAAEELINKGVYVNAQHPINGWTPLHWACKRGNLDLVALLLRNGADKNLRTEKGETPASLCNDNAQILRLLSVSASTEEPAEPMEPQSVEFVPNYLKNVPLNATVDLSQTRAQQGMSNMMDTARNVSAPIQDNELVLKIRIANTGDPDFVEIELPKNDLTFSNLLRICCDELGVGAAQVIRLRKLPNTKLRKDKDVQRLQDFQEIEIVTEMSNVYKYTQNCNGVLSSPHQVTPVNAYQSISKKDQTILY